MKRLRAFAPQHDLRLAEQSSRAASRIESGSIKIEHDKTVEQTRRRWPGYFKADLPMRNIDERVIQHQNAGVEYVRGAAQQQPFVRAEPQRRASVACVGAASRLRQLDAKQPPAFGGRRRAAAKNPAMHVRRMRNADAGGLRQKHGFSHSAALPHHHKTAACSPSPQSRRRAWAHAASRPSGRGR